MDKHLNYYYEYKDCPFCQERQKILMVDEEYPDGETFTDISGKYHICTVCNAWLGLDILAWFEDDKCAWIG